MPWKSFSIVPKWALKLRITAFCTCINGLCFFGVYLRWTKLCQMKGLYFPSILAFLIYRDGCCYRVKCSESMHLRLHAMHPNPRMSKNDSSFEKGSTYNLFLIPRTNSSFFLWTFLPIPSALPINRSYLPLLSIVCLSRRLSLSHRSPMASIATRHLTWVWSLHFPHLHKTCLSVQECRVRRKR